ncbi:MAG: hypothetical protein KDA32_07670 [Phycisphaerales bacterium]|nr:hypothetical protein [Phycisphaerales bacterium]
MNICIFEDGAYSQLMPLVWLRACFELRCGQSRLIDKIHDHFDGRVAAVWTRPGLREVVKERVKLEPAERDEPWLLLNARLLVTGDALPPRPGCAWTERGRLLGASIDPATFGSLSADTLLDEKRTNVWLEALLPEATPDTLQLIRFPWDLIAANGAELRRQFQNGGQRNGQVYDGAHLLNQSAIHIAEDAVVQPGVVLDAESGPITIARGARVEANAVLQGPCWIGPGAVVRPMAVVRGDTTIGPVCKVGGEIEATIFQGYANKQHDGFLGHSFVGQWVNLGADTVTSDLKNTYGAIRSYINGVGVETGQKFLGSIIGDHTKTGIGTILPTGCVLGVASNVFVQTGVPRFVPSFAWLTDDGQTRYRVDKAIDIARAVMGRRDLHLSDADETLMRAVAEEAYQREAAGWDAGG